MNLCENCRNGQLEMCQYFKENYLESGRAVRSCPEFDPDQTEMDVIELGKHKGKIRMVAGRAVRKAAAGERVMLLSSYQAAAAERMLQTMMDCGVGKKVLSVSIAMDGGGEIVIGGAKG